MFDQDVLLLIFPREALDLTEVEQRIEEVLVDLDRERLKQNGAIFDEENAVLCRIFSEKACSRLIY